MAGVFRVIEQDIPNVKLIESPYGEDMRGHSAKIYSKEALSALGVDYTPLEILTIHSKKDVLRGLHFQKKYGQSKIVSCVNGDLFVAVVDLDAKSESFGKWCSVRLNRPSQMLYVPGNCAVGTLAMADTDFTCICGDNPYIAEFDAGILWNDKKINIKWPGNAEDKIISEKDKKWPLFSECKESDRYEER